MKIRTRYAPSPTGRMHVGNLRTALYAYLVVTSLNVGVCDNAIIAACCAEIAISAMLIDNTPPTDTFEAFAYTQQELLLNTILFII